MKQHNQAICSACFRKHKGRPPCGGCKNARPDLTDRVRVIEWVAGQIGGGLVDGMGGVNGTVITESMKLYGIPKEDRGWVFRGVVTLIREMMIHGQ